MKLYPIPTGNFKLDGGAMFGVVPKTLWQKTNPADENNLCSWAMRCLLVESGDRLVLIDNGIGDKQDAKFFSHYYLYGDDSLEKSLHKAGFDFSDITDVFLTHLHFDHCGGSVKYSSNGTSFEMVFPKAQYWSNQDHWTWATVPNPREKASFLKENIMPLKDSGHLSFLEVGQQQFLPGFDVTYVDGHTDKMMVPRIQYKGRTVCFMADLLPSVGHLPLPYVMGYDTRPLLTLQEKEAFLNQAAAENWVLFLEHDSVNECCTVKQTEKGVRVDQVFPLSAL
ncbi:beta-lactamase [Rufibacter sp. DG15C]|uniref:MBL fold metallo-hydrolase n=1 Tax=Rufibacter sp. DG15C TaxID=1379909 RepID=UPI00078BA1DA|nr:MBL fold metallo-hydrolase [Rufibacter sp. DG15C]AMM52306.1 beta-lactamase [Rufibacter sp. DG15C]